MKIGKAAATGFDMWSLLAGAGIVAGTGGVGGVALLAWRGLRAARTLRQSHSPNQYMPPLRHPAPGSGGHGSQQPAIPLPPQSANFIQVPTDFRREAVDYALAETGRKYPGTIPALEVVKSLVNQHLQAHGHGQATLQQ